MNKKNDSSSKLLRDRAEHRLTEIDMRDPRRPDFLFRDISRRAMPGFTRAKSSSLAMHKITNLHSAMRFRPQWRTRALQAGVAKMECTSLLIGEVGTREREGGVD